MLLENVNDMLGTDIEDDDIDTIGGWFMTKRFDAVEGDSIEEQGFEFIAKRIRWSPYFILRSSEIT